MNQPKSLSNRYHTIGALLLAALVLTAACSGPVAGEKPSGASAAPLTEEALRNAEYRGIYQEAVRLTDGKYEGAPFVEGGASRPTATFTDAVAFGDLDGDGLDDAIVVLVESSGGSGSFLYLAAVLNRDGSPENMDTQSLGDRGQVEKLSVESGQMIIEMIVHGPDDPMCCPTQEVTLTYRLEGEQLVKASEEVSDPKKSDAEVAGSDTSGALWKTDITWQWSGLVETAPAAQSIVPDPENYTLLSRPDGTLHIKADCNMVGGSYTLEGTALTIELGPSTMAFCGEQSLDGQYLELLGNVDSYAVENGQLVLNLKAGAGRMTFIRGEDSN